MKMFHAKSEQVRPADFWLTKSGTQIDLASDANLTEHTEPSQLGGIQSKFCVVIKVRSESAPKDQL